MKKYPQVSLPDKIAQTLLLICEELKIRRLLHKEDIEECYLLSHLDSIILKNLGLDEDSKRVFRIYNNIMEKCSRKIRADNNSIMRQALKAYHDLLIEKRKLENV